MMVLWVIAALLAFLAFRSMRGTAQTPTGAVGTSTNVGQSWGWGAMSVTGRALTAAGLPLNTPGAQVINGQLYINGRTPSGQPAPAGLPISGMKV